MTRIKICGITTRADAELAIELGADAVGCVVVSGSKRYRTAKQVYEIFDGLPPYVLRVAVVVNPKVQLLEQLVDAAVDRVQFHGNESGQLIAKCPLPWYKAVAGVQGYIEGITAYPDSPALLVDAPMGGGKGKQWDWFQLPKLAQREKPLILAGGLNAHNLSEVIALVKPWAVDLASGVESAPGIKDRGLLAECIKQVKAND